jgi:ribosomal-protein-alanine N-acetyltransferase
VTGVQTCALPISVILLKGSESYLSRREGVRHNGAVLPEIDRLLSEGGLSIQDINVFSAVTGPGSFTGIRIGVTMMNAFKDVTGGKLVSVNTFEMLSEGQGDVITLVDAGHDEYYGAEFQDGKLIRMGDYKLADIDLALKKKVYRKDIDYSNALIAAVTRKAAKGEYAERLAPLYLKKSQAEKELIKKSFTISPMRDNHVEDVLTIERDSFITPWTASDYLGMLLNPLAYNFIIESNGAIIGYASVLRIYDELHIMSIAVKSSMRRLGYGDVMMEHILEYAKRLRVNSVTLEVRLSNVAAQALYEKYGFKCVGMRKKYYEFKEDALIYTLII